MPTDPQSFAAAVAPFMPVAEYDGIEASRNMIYLTGRHGRGPFSVKDASRHLLGAVCEAWETISISKHKDGTGTCTIWPRGRPGAARSNSSVLLAALSANAAAREAGK